MMMMPPGCLETQLGPRPREVFNDEHLDGGEQGLRGAHLPHGKVTRSKAINTKIAIMMMIPSEADQGAYSCEAINSQGSCFAGSAGCGQPGQVFQS